LVADDDAGSRLGFRVALETAGYEVIEAADGAQALVALRDAPIDVALLDLRMPGLDGMEVLRRIHDEGIEVPVVVITAHGNVPGAIRATELGAVDVLAKPVQPSILRQAVLQVLLQRPRDETGSYRPAVNSLGTTAQRFGETVTLARRAWERGRFALAEHLLQQALDLDPDSAAANTLRGALQERLGEHHAAYQSYRKALARDPHEIRALDGMNRYCERFGLDYHNRAINPAVE
jgi:DNA-binding response OmpR family regulator